MYKLIKNTLTSELNTVVSLSDNSFIPFDPANVDFQQYQKWLSEGNTPISADTGETL
jgi:hypothetical protein